MPRDLSPSTKRVLTSAVTNLYSFCEAGDPARMASSKKHYVQKVKSKPIVFDEIAIRVLIDNLTSPRYLANSIKQANKARKTITRLSILRDRLFVLMIVDGGFRISELWAMKRGDVDWKSKRTMITGKGDKVAIIYFSPRVMQAMKEYLEARAELDGKSGKPLRSLPLFISHDIRAKRQFRTITTFGMRKSIKSHVPGVTFRIHDLRHYFVTTIMRASGGNLKLAQELARHESITMTQRYAHYSESDVEKGYREIFNQ
jgi:integrase